jgi:hypothetical protein
MNTKTNNHQNEPTTTTLEQRWRLERRFITAVQGKGRLGKSLLLAALIEYLRYVGVLFKALDSDALNLSLANRYPTEFVRGFDVTQDKNDFGIMLAHLPDLPVVILDSPSQFTTKFLAWVDHYNLLEMFRQTGTRMTMFIFQDNDLDARTTAAQLVDQLGNAIDWVMVDNPKISKEGSQEFKRTGIYDALVGLGAPTLVMPEIQEVTKGLWEALEEKHGRAIPIGEASTHPELNLVARMDLSGFLDRMFAQFETHAGLLLPDVGLIKTKVVRVKQDTGAPKARLGRFNNPLLAKK